MAGAATAPLAGASRRAALLEEIVRRVKGEEPRGTLVRSPRGWGKGELLARVAREAAAGGVARCVELDMAACSFSPGEFACTITSAALEAVIPGGSAGVTGMAGAPPPEARLRALAGSGALAVTGEAGEGAAEVLDLLESGSGGGAALVRASLRTLQRVAARADVPCVLVVHALDGAARLAPYPGLRGVLGQVSQALGAPGVRFVASISPEGRAAPLVANLEKALGNDLALMELPPLELEEVRTLAGGFASSEVECGRLLAAAGGRFLTIRILGTRLAGGDSLERALADEMEPEEGRIFHEMRFDYHMLIERTRGHASCRAILNVLAREEGLDLSGIAGRLRRSAGSTLDYLRWMTEVALVRRDGRRYRFTDPLLRLYVLLHETPERPREAPGRTVTIRRFLSGLEAPPLPLRPVGRPRGKRLAAPGTLPAPVRRRREAPPDAPSPAPPGRDKRDDFIEID